MGVGSALRAEQGTLQVQGSPGGQREPGGSHRMSNMRAVPLRLGLVALLTSTPAAQPPTRPAPSKFSSTAIHIEYDVRVPMREGTTLSADVYRPRGDAPVPVILVRTPYDNGVAGHVA